MKAKNRYTEDFYSLITDAWPIPGHMGGLICGDDEESGGPTASYGWTE